MSRHTRYIDLIQIFDREPTSKVAIHVNIVREWILAEVRVDRFWYRIEDILIDIVHNRICYKNWSLLQVICIYKVCKNIWIYNIHNIFDWLSYRTNQEFIWNNHVRIIDYIVWKNVGQATTSNIKKTRTHWLNSAISFLSWIVLPNDSRMFFWSRRPDNVPIVMSYLKKNSLPVLAMPLESLEGYVCNHHQIL